MTTDLADLQQQLTAFLIEHSQAPATPRTTEELLAEVRRQSALPRSEWTPDAFDRYETWLSKRYAH